MPKTAAKFGHELQMALQPMVLKPNGSSIQVGSRIHMTFMQSLISSRQVLQEIVACMCIVIQCLTHDFTRLVNLIKSCNGGCFVFNCVLCLMVGLSARLQQAIKRPPLKIMDAKETWTLSILIFIVSLLGENCDFDHLRREHSGTLRAVVYIFCC